MNISYRSGPFQHPMLVSARPYSAHDVQLHSFNPDYSNSRTLLPNHTPQRRVYPVDEVYLEDISEVMPGLGPGSREYEWIQRQLQQFRRADQSGEGLCGMPAMLPEFVLKVGARAIIEAAAYEPGKGVLAFLSGIGEIEALAEQVPKTA